MQIQALWGWLIGARKVFSLENRIFNAVSVMSFICLLVFVFYNVFVVSIPLLFVVTIVASLIQLLWYYLARFKNKFSLARIGYVIGTYLFLLLNFYYSGGVDGGAMIGFFLIYILFLVVSPRKEQLIITIAYCILTTIAVWLEYANVIVVKNPYLNAQSRFVDIIGTNILMSLMAFLVLRYLIDNYKKERKLVEAKSKEISYLHSENKRLIAVLSHDLRSPLNSIKGFLELLQQGLLNDNEQEFMLSQLSGLTRNTALMLDDLIVWSKLQMEGDLVDVKEVDIESAIGPTLDVMKAVAGEKNLVLTTLVKGASAYCDPNMLQIVVRNLISNSIKFTNPGGKILVSATMENAGCIIEVSDNGLGIPLEKQAEVFSSRAKSTSGTFNEKGFGLGLMLCKDFIVKQGGDINFVSVPGEGSSFFIKLKAKER